MRQEYFRIPESATIIGMSKAYLRKTIRLGKGPQIIRCGKSPVIHIDELHRWMASRAERVGTV